MACSLSVENLVTTAGGWRLGASQLGLPGEIPLFGTRPPSSPKAHLICLFICLLISNSTLLRNNFRKLIFEKFHLVVSFVPTSFWVKPPEYQEGGGAPGGLGADFAC